MIKKFKFYHGVVLARVVHHNKGGATIRSYPTESNSSYIVDDSIGLYIKYCTNRMTPWKFSFSKAHQDEILDMQKDLSKVFVVFVCSDNGIAVLSFDELKHILDHDHQEMEWISLHRRPREKFTVKGSDGKLHFKIGDNNFPKKIFE